MIHGTLTPQNTARIAVCTLLGACSGAQSALDPAGREGERIADLFWWMAGGAGLIWLAVVGLSVYATWSPQQRRSANGARRCIVLGGVLLPTVVLGGLLIQGPELKGREKLVCMT